MENQRYRDYVGSRRKADRGKLPDRPVDLTRGLVGVVTGWGRTGVSASAPMSASLQAVKVREISRLSLVQLLHYCALGRELHSEEISS